MKCTCDSLKFLFLLKLNNSYGQCSVKSGLLNSVQFLSIGLLCNFDNLKSKVATCIDGNSVDKEVHAFKPDVCFIEALWVTPAKLKELVKLHPKVTFIVRVHSKITFLANEGIAIEWIKEYDKIKNVKIAFNNKETAEEIKNIGIDCIYLPNIYEVVCENLSFIDKIKLILKKPKKRREVVNIGCFGAIRPMKNQLQQAVGAIRYGIKYNKIVHFHMNVGRIEQHGENILKNIRALFKGTDHKLIEHGWLNHDEFITIINKMDIGLQVSLTESFNIVSADFIENRIPVIVSKSIDWTSPLSQVDYEDAEQLATKINDALNKKDLYTRLNTEALDKYNKRSIKVWAEFIKGQIKNH